MKVVLVTLYDESARGTRYVASSAQSAGHRVAFVHVEGFRSLTIRRQDTERLAWAMAQSPCQVREITAQGERFHPYPSPISDAERRLLADLLDHLKPDVIGLAFATHAYNRAVELTELMRATCPAVPIVWGGIHATIDPESAIAHADVVCVGEGEEAFVEYLADRTRTDIAGLWFRTPSGPVKNPRRPLIQDLDRLPWPIYGGDEYQIEEDRVGREIAQSPERIACFFCTETTRGCPFACSFCFHSTWRGFYPNQGYVRPRSAENVVEEIRQFRQRFGLQAVLPFFDEVLLINKNRFAQFARLYRREIGHPFSGFAHAKTTDREMLEMARDAGSVEISIGVQTGSERIARDVYNRALDKEATLRLAHDIRQTGAGRLILNILADCQWEREEDLRATFELLAEMPRPYLLQLSRLVPFPNTALAAMKRPPDAGAPMPQHVREFWHQMYMLTQTERLDVQALRALADAPNLREKPETLDALVEQMSPVELLPAEQRLQCLAPSRQTAAATSAHSGGRLRRLYRKLRDRLAGVSR